MNIAVLSPVLKTKLGNDGLRELRDVLDMTRQEWKGDVLETAVNRFERRLSEEAGALRVEIAVEIGKVRTDMASMRGNLVHWMFAISMTQLGITLTVMALMFHAARLF